MGLGSGSDHDEVHWESTPGICSHGDPKYVEADARRVGPARSLRSHSIFLSEVNSNPYFSDWGFAMPMLYDWVWMLQGNLKALCRNLEELEQLQVVCKTKCSLGFRTYYSSFFGINHQRQSRCGIEDKHEVAKGCGKQRSSAAAATCKVSYGLAEAAESHLRDVFVLSSSVRSALSEPAPMPSFEGLVGKHLARKLFSRLSQDLEVWWRGEGQQFQGLLQDWVAVNWRTCPEDCWDLCCVELPGVEVNVPAMEWCACNRVRRLNKKKLSSFS